MAIAQERVAAVAVTKNWLPKALAVLWISYGCFAALVLLVGIAMEASSGPGPGLSVVKMLFWQLSGYCLARATAQALIQIKQLQR